MALVLVQSEWKEGCATPRTCRGIFTVATGSSTWTGRLSIVQTTLVERDGACDVSQTPTTSKLIIRFVSSPLLPVPRTTIGSGLTSFAMRASDGMQSTVTRVRPDAALSLTRRRSALPFAWFSETEVVVVKVTTPLSVYVGAAVGEDVGVELEADENGDEDGTEVSVVVGAIVGTVVGAEVVGTVGAAVGIEVGEVVGADEGADVGADVSTVTATAAPTLWTSKLGGSETINMVASNLFVFTLLWKSAVVHVIPSLLCSNFQVYGQYP